MVSSWRRIRNALVLIMFVFVAFNVLAYRHAKAMLNYEDFVERTARPEELGVIQKLRVLFTGVRVPRPAAEYMPSRFGLKHDTQILETDDGIDLEVWRMPAASEARGSVLMFPGYAESKSTLLEEARAFHELGFDVQLVDFRGAGGSTDSPVTLGFHEALDVRKVFEVERGAKPDRDIILFGRSMGGAAILRAISEGMDEPEAIIIESVFDRLETTIENRFRAMGLPAFPGAQALLFWGGHQNGFLASDHNPADYAQKVRVPVLQLHGVEDPRVSVEEAMRIQENLAGPTQFVAIERAGHEPLRQVDPESWDSSVSLFLQGQSSD